MHVETMLTGTAIWRDLDIVERCAINTMNGKVVCATPLASYCTEEGHFAEHLTTPRRFRHFY